MKRRSLIIGTSGLATTLATIATNSSIANAARGRIVNIGNDLKGYLVAPNSRQKAPAIIVLIEAFGLNNNIKNFCDRFAHAGYVAIAPDLYRGEVFPYTNVDAAVAKLKTMQDNLVAKDLSQTLDFLDRHPRVARGKIGVTGFCMGGRYTFLAGTTAGNRVRALVSFYGGGISPEPNNPFNQTSLIDDLTNLSAPLMLMYGAKDSFIGSAEHERITRALSATKKRYSLNVFANADHGFMSDRRDNYNPQAAAEAWEMTLAFFKQHI